MNSRLGKFRLHEEMVKSMPKATLLIMAKCLILRCEFNYARKAFEYEACCDLFDELSLGQALPEYRFAIDEKGNVTVEKL